MLRIAFGICAATLTIAPFAASAEDNAVHQCVDVSIPRQAIQSRNGRWIELTSEQWQFLRGVYAMSSETPPQLPYGDKAVLADVDGSSTGLVFFIDGDKACTPMLAPPQLLALMREVGTGSVIHESASLSPVSGRS